MFAIMKCVGVLFLLYTTTQGGRPYDLYMEGSLEIVVNGSARFASELYEPLTKYHRQHVGLVSSPFGVHMALSMLLRGASGETEQILTEHLHVMDPFTTADGYSQLLKKMSEAQDVKFVVANKVYITDKKHVKESFNSTVVDKFRSEVESLDFTQPDTAVKTINTWVEGKTNQPITFNNMWTGAVTETTDMVVVNSVYFKGEWLHPFHTLPDCSHSFTKDGKDNVRVAGISVTENFNYKEDAELDAQVIEIPYTHDEYSMILVSPLKLDGISDLENKIINYDLTKILDGVSLKKVNLSIPKFGLEYGTYLEQTLTEIGFGNIFEPQANFSGLVDDSDLHVTNIIQRTSISVDEKGTDAATDQLPTGSADQVSSDPPTNEPATSFNVDHQFMFFVVRKVTSLSSKLNILLYGEIIDISSTCS